MDTTADQIKPGNNIVAYWAGCQYIGAVRSVGPAQYSTLRYKSEHVLITFVGGGFYPGQDQSISIPATQLVELKG